MRFDGLIFDMDGTLTKPMIDFRAMREELKLPAGDLAKEIARLPEPEQMRAWAIVERHEAQAMARQELQPGAGELLRDCRAAGMRLGLVTRNAMRSVEHLCERFALRFDAVLTREFPFLKPHPGPILHILEDWGMPADRALVIGDYLYDLESGRAAGALTCFFHNNGTRSYAEHADYAVASMAELRRIVLKDEDEPHPSPRR